MGTGNHVLGVILRTRMQVAGIGRSRGIARGRARSGLVALGVEGKRDSVHPDLSFGSWPEAFASASEFPIPVSCKPQLPVFDTFPKEKRLLGSTFRKTRSFSITCTAFALRFSRVAKTFKNPMKVHHFSDQSCAVVPIWISSFPCQALTKSLP